MSSIRGFFGVFFNFANPLTSMVTFIGLVAWTGTVTLIHIMATVTVTLIGRWLSRTSLNRDDETKNIITFED